MFHHQPNAKAKLNWFCPVSLWQGGKGFPSGHHNPSRRPHPLPYVLGLTRVSVANTWRGRWGSKACLGLQDKRAHSKSGAQGTAQFCRPWMIYFRQQHETAWSLEKFLLHDSFSLHTTPQPFRFLHIFLFCGPRWVPLPSLLCHLSLWSFIWSLWAEKPARLQAKLYVWSSISNSTMTHVYHIDWEWEW